MGTHPIFESDFDCLTENLLAMRHLLLYKQVKGVPRRLLSVSSRASGGGQFHESDDCVPKEFIEAMYSMPEEARPHPGVLLQRDMTPELIAEKAAKYNILPEDYMPMSITCSGGFGGDYPTIVEESQYNKEFNFEWDNFNHKRNYGEIWGMFQHTHRAAAMCQIYDGSFHPYGLYQYWQMWYLYFAWCFFLIYGYFIHSWLFTPFTYSSFDRWTRALQNTCLHKDRSWSKTELEWMDVFLKVEQTGTRTAVTPTTTGTCTEPVRSGSASLELMRDDSDTVLPDAHQSTARRSIHTCALLVLCRLNLVTICRERFRPRWCSTIPILPTVTEPKWPIC